MKFAKPLLMLASAALVSAGLASTAGSATASPTGPASVSVVSSAYGQKFVLGQRAPVAAKSEIAPYHRRTIAEIAKSAQQQSYVVDLTNGVPSLGPTIGRSAGGPIDDCRKMNVGDYHKGKVVSHFIYCDKWHQNFIYTDQNKKPVGVKQFDAILVGQGRNGSRDVELTLHLENFSSAGDTRVAPDPLVNMEIYCFPGLGDIGGCDNQNPGDLQTQRLFSAWQASPEAYYSMKSKDTTGVGPEKVNIAGWQFIVEALQVQQSETILNQSVRFDSAGYLNSPKGAIFSEVTPHILYSKANGSNVQAVAQHIYDACNHPSKTFPKINNKKVAGCTDNYPLHRLYYDRKRKNNNHAAAVRACRAAYGQNYTSGGKDCDEFPFQSTYEGAWRDKAEPGFPYGMFSARALNAKQNQKAGSNLSTWYGTDRILDWSWTGPGTTIRDPFVVWIR